MTATLLTLLILAADCAPCSSGAQCIEGECQFTCRTNDDCQRGLVCSESGFCEAKLRRLPGQPPTLRRGDATHPERFRYGGVVPPGYHLVSQINWAAAAGGLATFAVAYVPFVVLGTVTKTSLNFIPFIGPIVAWRPNSELSVFVNALIVIGIGVDAIVQLSGVTRLILALAVPVKWLERDVTVSFAPVAPGAEIGASVVGRF